MNLELLAATLLPLILFVVIEIKRGFRQGIWAAMIFSLAACAYLYWRFGEIDELALVEVALILLLGWISLKLKSPRFIKFQPVLVAVIFSLYLIYLNSQGQPIFLRMMPILEQLNPQAATQLSSPRGQDLLRALSEHIVYLFAIHGVLVLYGALKLGSFGWLMTRLAFYPLALAFFAYEILVASPLVH